MNKFGFVLGVAAVATLAGCKDPDYKYESDTASRNEVKNIDTTVVEQTAPVVIVPETKPVPEVKPVVVVPETKPVPEVKPVAEPEYTIYVVQNGDYLAKISKKYNVTIAAIKRLNPSIKKDIIRVGQKLKLPGKLDVPVVAVKEPTTPKANGAKKSPRKAYAPYTGATKEYVVKSGDTLGSIAYGNGINIRQLKELNGLSKDSLKIGQKLKIPAEKVATAKKAAPVKDEKKPVAAEVKPAAATDSAAPEADANAVAPAPEAKQDETPAPAAETKSDAPATTTYVVQEGDDMTGVSIRWGVSAADIRELNNLSDTDQLVPGQIIKLPAEAQQ